MPDQENKPPSDHLQSEKARLEIEALKKSLRPDYRNATILISALTVMLTVIGLMIQWRNATKDAQNAQEQQAAAEYQLEKLRYDVEALRHGEAALDFDIEPTQKKIPNEKGYYVAIAVKIKNIGTRPVVLCFEDPYQSGNSNCSYQAGNPCEIKPGTQGLRPLLPPIRVVRAIPASQGSDGLIIDKNAKIIVASMYRPDCADRPITGIRVRVGQTELYAAAVRLQEAGYYSISFFSYLPDEEKNSLLSPSFVRLPPLARPFWSVHTFFAVGPPMVQQTRTAASLGMKEPAPR